MTDRNLKPVGVLLEDVIGTGKAAEILAERKTIEEWGDKLGIFVSDPDGFNRQDVDLYRRYFTKDEFLKGAYASTVLNGPWASEEF